MFAVIIKNKVKMEGKDDYIEESKLFAQDMMHVDGCQQAYVLTSLDEEDIVVNFELWQSKEKFEAYDGSVFLAHKAKLKPNFLGNTTELYSV